MTGAAPSPSSRYFRAPAARFAAAIAASGLVHWALLSAPLIDSPLLGVTYHPGAAPITVRIAPVPVLVLEPPAPPEERRASLRAATRAEGSEGSLSTSAPSGAQSPSPFPGSDAHYYLARELDSYPALLAPLQLERSAGGGAGEVQLEILVDERGVVQDVFFATPDAPGRAAKRLRALLAATYFLPARKDGRAVKSRVVLRVSFDPEARTR